MISRLVGLAALATFLGVSVSSHASIAFKAAQQKWQFADVVDADLQKEVCSAFTNQSDSTEPVELVMLFPKDGKTLPQIRVRSKLSAPMIAVQLDSKTTQPLFQIKAATNADE